MEPVSLAFAAVSMVELCLRCGKDITERCQSYRHADTELRLTVLEVSGHWLRIEKQIVIINDLWDRIDVRTQVHLQDVFQELERILQSALYALDNLIGNPQKPSNGEKTTKTTSLNRIRYAVHGKKSLEDIVKNLEKWHRLFDPSWFLISRSSVPALYWQLASSDDGGNSAISTVVGLMETHSPAPVDTPSPPVFLSADYQLWEMNAIPLAPAHFGINPSGKPVIVDHYPIRDDVPIDSAKKDVRFLARVLSKVDPAFSSLLRCEGVLQPGRSSTTELQHFQMVFELPAVLENVYPVSLRSLLLEGLASYPLNDRINLATSLARSVVFLHASRIVHKNISPENIVLLRQGTNSLGSPFLVGFERFRFDDWQTNLSGDELWEKNLYRHPQRQGAHPEDRYTMRHDMYSVGVCLLEIGLRRSFVRYADDEQVTGPDPELDFAAMLSVKNKRAAAKNIQTEFVRLAEERLPQLMGQMYTDIVVSCLTCLDPGNLLFQDASEFEDEDGILVGVRYIEKASFPRYLDQGVQY
ncbi:hypothetical protein N7492_008603 [Penicillium capsulatum]|uniref:Protein kinase domain-containing protein n=1 Tax=Penicillium capsulatum TaxID=69766 RepID=A0A9W9LHF4_9EURO|nr:hypothetical protein N7492_008603 [Penicillium capsulatum]KAJ6106008.1 hypothetical protein N7512_009525 [Penicillium capsulatum]